jgi:hypothetical protein
MYRSKLDSAGSGYVLMANFCENGNVSSGSIKAEISIAESKYQFYKASPVLEFQSINKISKTLFRDVLAPGRLCYSVLMYIMTWKPKNLGSTWDKRPELMVLKSFYLVP